MDELFKKYKNLLYKYCTEEYLVEGLLCLQNCAKGFDPTKGNFSSYLRVALKREIRKAKNRDRKIDEEYKTTMDPIVEKDNIDIDLSVLSVLQKYVIEEFYWREHSILEIATRLKLTYRDVAMIKLEAEQKLRERLQW